MAIANNNNSPINNNIAVDAATRLVMASNAAVLDNTDLFGEMGFSLDVRGIFRSLAFWRRPTIGDMFADILATLKKAWNKMSAAAKAAVGLAAGAVAGFPIIKSAAMAYDRRVFEGVEFHFRTKDKSEDDVRGTVVSWMRETDLHGRRLVIVKTKTDDAYALVADETEIRLADKEDFPKSSKVTGEWKRKRFYDSMKSDGRKAVKDIKETRNKLRKELREARTIMPLRASKVDAIVADPKSVEDMTAAELAEASAEAMARLQALEARAKALAEAEEASEETEEVEEASEESAEEVDELSLDDPEIDAIREIDAAKRTAEQWFALLSHDRFDFDAEGVEADLQAAGVTSFKGAGNMRSAVLKLAAKAAKAEAAEAEAA